MIGGGRSRVLSLGIAASVCLALLSPTSAMPPASPQEHSHVDVPLTPTEALLVDANEYAAEFAVSVNEAQRRLALQRELGVVIEAVRIAAQSRFAGGYIQHVPSYEAVIRLSGRGVPSAIASFIAGSGMPITVEEGAKHSLDEVLGAVVQIEATVRATAPEAAITIDERSSTVIVTTPNPPAGLLERLTAIVEIPIELRDGPPYRAQHTYGGKRLEHTGIASPPICTTGFTVRNTATGLRGVTTAGHCQNGNVTYRETSTITYPLGFISEVMNDHADAQFMANSAHTVYPYFWTGAGYRTVLGTVPRLNMTGDYVCHQGAFTGYSCGIVQTIHGDPGDRCGINRNGPCANTWVEVQGSELACWEADSGGPWFSGSWAYGTHAFGRGPGPEKGSCFGAMFMSAGFLGELDLVLLTG